MYDANIVLHVASHAAQNACLAERSTSRPCFPSRISFMKLIMPTQMMGETSTPPTGGTKLLVGFSKGSVGRYATTHGNRYTGTDVYQVMTMRMMKRMVVTENNGPRKPASSFAWSGSRGSSATPRSQSA